MKTTISLIHLFKERCLFQLIGTVCGNVRTEKRQIILGKLEYNQAGSKLHHLAAGLNYYNQGTWNIIKGGISVAR